MCNSKTYCILNITLKKKKNPTCRVTNRSPNPGRNRGWAQYNKFVREWAKELG